MATGIIFKVTARMQGEERKVIELPKAIRNFIQEGKEYKCTLEELK